MRGCINYHQHESFKYMTETEKTSFAGLIKELAEWMRDSSGCDESDLCIADLIKDSGDIYEVIIIFHLINGEHITLRNHCYESFTEKRYCGDEMLYQSRIGLSDNTEDDGYVEITSFEKTYHKAYMSLSSICYIEAGCVNLNWYNLYKYSIK